MEMENTLAQNISVAGENASYDAACKKLLANKIILAWFMKSCLEEYSDMDANEIAGKYIEGEPQIARIAVHPDEMADQNDFYPGYPIVKRGIYYCSRLISSQYGVEFTNTHYEKIKKVSSIWICLNSPGYRKNTINRYTIQEENLIGDVAEKKENYDLMTAVIICLGSSENDNYTGILKLLDVLLSSEKEPEEKDSAE